MNKNPNDFGYYNLSEHIEENHFVIIIDQELLKGKNSRIGQWHINHRYWIDIRLLASSFEGAYSRPTQMSEMKLEEHPWVLVRHLLMWPVLLHR